MAVTPLTSNFAPGLAVPIPTFPPLVVRTEPPIVRFEEKRFVEEAVVAKKAVLVAFVVVLNVEVKLGNTELVDVVAVK